LLDSWKSIGSDIKGWKKSGLLRPFEKEFQLEAMETHTKSSLFSNVASTNSSEQCEKEEEDWNELFENKVSKMMLRCLAI